MDLTKLTIIGWQKFMSAIGNIAAAQTAKTIGKYNENLLMNKLHTTKKAAVQQKVFNTIERPRFVKQQEQAYSNFFVMLLELELNLEKEQLHF